MKKYFKQSVIALFTLVLLVGCHQKHYVATPKSPTLADHAQNIADGLILNLKENLTSDDSIIVATFADVNDLEKSSTFGRIFADQVAARFTQRGYRVIEVRLREGSVFMKQKEGEFVLSRDIEKISMEHKASAVVVGTYAEGDNVFYVSARIVNPSDGIVVSAFNGAVPVNNGTQYYLGRLSRNMK